jgi:hypothetical protein
METYPAALERLGAVDARLREELSGAAAAIVDRPRRRAHGGRPHGLGVFPSACIPAVKIFWSTSWANPGPGSRRRPTGNGRIFGPLQRRRFIEVIAETLGRRMDTDRDALILGER